MSEKCFICGGENTIAIWVREDKPEWYCWPCIGNALSLLTRVEAGDAVIVEREVVDNAIDWMESDGCDCGTDEKGTCALCRMKQAAVWNAQEVGP